MSDRALAAAIRPNVYASSTTGVKKSVVRTSPWPPGMRTTAASSPSSRPTTSSALGAAGPVAVSPATTDSSSPGGILQAHPPPCAYWVNRTAGALSAVTVTNLGGSPEPRGVRPPGRPPQASSDGIEFEEQGMSDTPHAPADGTAAAGADPAGRGPAGVRPVAAGLAVVV